MQLPGSLSFQAEGFPVAKAFWQALLVTLVIIVGIKWLTGVALMPLLLIAILVLGLSLGLSLRLERARRHS
jgi:hypothetical protein